ncbi:G5 domain-containing protein, partial [Gemella sp. 20925_1_85]|uniref:G5 domain-containing protein n=1 Tax=Gemella sp. 20925_1_85 TaxID=3003690 RepID=UPI00352BDB80
MKNKSKTNWKIDENTTEKFNRYGIRKYNVGAASVAILSGLFFLGGADAQAAETGSSQTAAQAVATESGSSATANTWEKAITTVVEKEKSTNVAATGTTNKPVETVAPKAVEAQTAPKETVATTPKAETREANVATPKAETREASVETPKAETREVTTAPKAEVATTNNTANVGSTRSADNGYSGFRAAPAPTNQPVTNLGNNTVFTDISRGSHSFRGNGNSRGGNPIHFDVTTTRVGNRVEFSIAYSGPGEFVNNNFILDKGNGFGEPSQATISTNRLREQYRTISRGGNFVSHSGYSLQSAVSTNSNQTIRFSLPITNPNGDLSVRLRPVTFNVAQGESGSATSNDPYSNSNYYFREKPLYLDANPSGAASTHKVSEVIDFQTVYLPTSKLAEGQTRLVREGVNGRREITYKVHRLGQETLLGLPINRTVAQEAQPRIVQIGVAKELIDTVKPRVDQNKVGDTNNLTFYLDNDGNGVYTEGVDELIQKVAIKDGAKGDQGERGLTGAQGAKG